MSKKYLLLILFLLNCGSSPEATLVQENTATSSSSTSITTTTTVATLNEFELPYKHSFYDFENCNDFLGSSHNISCFEAPQIEKIFQFESPINNLT